jgi:hypothetical protein
VREPMKKFLKFLSEIQARLNRIRFHVDILSHPKSVKKLLMHLYDTYTPFREWADKETKKKNDK